MLYSCPLDRRAEKQAGSVGLPVQHHDPAANVISVVLYWCCCFMAYIMWDKQMDGPTDTHQTIALCLLLSINMARIMMVDHQPACDCVIGDDGAVVQQGSVSMEQNGTVADIDEGLYSRQLWVCCTLGSGFQNHPGFPLNWKTPLILCWTGNFWYDKSIYAGFETDGCITYKLISVTKEWMVNVSDECLVFYIFWLQTMTESIWKILKLDWKLLGNSWNFFLQ